MKSVDIVKSNQGIFDRVIAQRTLMKEKKKKSTDILNKPPISYLAYANEIGAAISPINKTLGNALYATSLMHLGAYVYDKYKSEDAVYNPNSKGNLRQAVSYGLAGVVLPTVAIKTGQAIGVRVNTGKQSLSAVDKKELVEFTLNHLENTVFPKREEETFADDLIQAFKQKAMTSKIKIKNRTFKDKLFLAFRESKDYDSAISKYIKDEARQETIIKYLQAQGEIVDDIMISERNIQADKYVKFFNKANSKYGNVQVAKLDTISKLLKDKTMNKSLVATMSGFIALLLMIKPIDYFTDEVLMQKIVNPLLDKIMTKKNKKQNVS